MPLFKVFSEHLFYPRTFDAQCTCLTYALFNFMRFDGYLLQILSVLELSYTLFLPRQTFGNSARNYGDISGPSDGSPAMVPRIAPRNFRTQARERKLTVDKLNIISINRLGDVHFNDYQGPPNF